MRKTKVYIAMLNEKEFGLQTPLFAFDLEASANEFVAAHQLKEDKMLEKLNKPRERKTFEVKTIERING